jgi:hypothetical protein
MTPVNSGTMRIVIIVALIVTGVAVLSNGFVEQGAAVPQSGSAAPPTSTEPSVPPAGGSPTETPTATETPKPNSRGVLIKVFNGTAVTGLGAEVQTLLVDDGYVAPEDAANAPIPGVKRTIVYYREGDNEAQGRADATYVSKTYFNGKARVEVLADAYVDQVTNPVQLAIVVGQDYADSVAA